MVVENVCVGDNVHNSVLNRIGMVIAIGEYLTVRTVSGREQWEPIHCEVIEDC